MDIHGPIYVGVFEDALREIHIGIEYPLRHCRSLLDAELLYNTLNLYAIKSVSAETPSSATHHCNFRSNSCTKGPPRVALYQGPL